MYETDYCNHLMQELNVKQVLVTYADLTTYHFQEQIDDYDEFDNDLIYSAFKDQYSIDLQEIEYLHWWKFKAMFDALKDDNKIVEIMFKEYIK